jgi:Flp pilus assembly protein TadD
MRSIVLCSCLIATVACTGDAAKHKHFENGRQNLLAGKVSDAVVELRTAVAIDEKWGAARLLLADAYAASGQPELARRQYVRAADLMPDDAEAQIKAGTALLLNRQFGNARARAERLLRTSPQNVEAQILRANALAGLRDVDGAEAQLRAAIASEPRSEAYTSLAALHLARDRAPEAGAAYQKALEVDPRSIPAHLAFAKFQWRRDDRAAAEQTLQRALSVNAADLSIRRALVSFYVVSGRLAAAEPHLKFLAETTDVVDDHLALADYYEDNGRLDEARRVLDGLVARPDARPADVETRLARLDDAQGHKAEAAERLSAVLSKAPSSAAALVLRAEWSMRDGRWEDARAAASAAIATNPRLASAYLLRAEADFRTHRDADAIADYTKVMRLDPDTNTAAVALSRLHLSRDSVDSAVLYAEEAVKRVPEDLEARLALVRAWMARGSDETARAELDRLVRQHSSAELFTLAGFSRLKQGDMVAAHDAFERALRLDATSVEALTTLTALDVRARDFTAARRRVDAALAAKPDDPRLLLVSGKLALAAGDLRLGEAQLRRAIDLDPLDATAFTLLARVFLSEGRLANAVQEFDALAESNPGSIAPRLMAAVAVDTAGDDANAEQRYRQILNSEPRAALAAKNLAVIYLLRGESLTLAEQLASRAAEQLSGHGEAFDTLGLIHLRLARIGAAIRSFERAVALEPANATFRYHLGSAYAKSGERDRAGDAFRDALRLNAGLTEARQALDSLSR